ncbi:ATP-binding protein [Pseudomonas yamanorum]|nr:ATP-binding protein [Pseudomonas yamanorum]
MLGRQQIAGIPTAIHELFKNAHDAYAERVEVDFYRRSRTLVLRDDGYGMTRDDLESRWLTLGTESRVNANNEEEKDHEDWRGPLHPPKRVIMGEKGIGRLAIAVIAPITLLMTRAVRPDGLHDLVVALIHWGIFEQPGIDISAIDIPIREFASGTLPTREQVAEFVDRVEENLRLLETEINPNAFKVLWDDLQRARAIDPDKLDKNLNAGREKPLSLSGDGYGTHFVVFPVAPELDDDIDGGADKESSKLERNLLGFSNSMVTNEPVITTEFRDHKLNEIVSRIGPRNFFTVDDFLKTDQLFEGEFDEHGQFVGAVTIYGKSRRFVCNWTGGNGRQPRCGPFSFRYGYVQGNASETSLAPEDWTAMTEKTDRLGGIYIYRDGIRILPYGNSDYDFLEIEKRRTKSAADWFFSYRRGFGYVSISHEKNWTLTEKAGREGFRENQAYRDFRSILINFFQQLAFEFFRRTSVQGEDYWAGKESFTLQSELLKKQKKKANNRRNLFDAELKEFSKKYEDGFFEAESSRVKWYVRDKLALLLSEQDVGVFSGSIRDLEMEARSQIRALYSQTAVQLPRGLALTERLRKDWAAYEYMSGEVRESLLEPLRFEVETEIRKVIDGRIPDVERRAIALQDIERERDNTVKALVSLRRETSLASREMQQALRSVLQEEFSQLRVNVELLVAEFARNSAQKPAELERIRNETEAKIAELRQKEFELFDSFRRQMVELTEGVKDRETLDDRFAALEARNQILEEQIEFYAEFAQMGMSVGILQHEFERAARGIRVSMSELKPWADRNSPIAIIYKSLREHIDHLEGYLKVLDPLGRRMHRSVVKISGDEILTVIHRVFDEILDSSNIKLVVTHEFRARKVDGKSSAILGAFLNVVDNAVYWLNSRSEGEKNITLDADDVGFLISNNGPGIEERIKHRIFDFGETKKPGGRGMGLAISRETLNREGFEIDLVKTGLDVSPQFRIWPKEEQGEQDDGATS